MPSAAALTFVSLFALVPLLTVTLSIASALPAAGDIRRQTKRVSGPVFIARKLNPGGAIPVDLYRTGALADGLWRDHTADLRHPDAAQCRESAQ